VKSISGFERVVMCLAFGPDGKTIAAGTQDGQVWVWSVASGKPFQLIDVGSRGMRMIAFSPDGRRMVSVTNNSPVMLWDVAPVPDDAGDWQ
jgi:WD40 repeat protein